jgi:DUF4097 and DUF4098 domain-containing protein YvlB
VWLVLAAVLIAAADSSAVVPSAAVDLSTAARTAKVDVTDRQVKVVAMPPGKTLSIDITIGNVRIDGWDKPELEIVIERRAPAAAQFARLPLAIEDTPARVTVRALQTDDTTEPALRADISVRVPRQAVIERVDVLEGRIAIDGFGGRLTASIRRGPIEGKDVSGTLRLETEIGAVVLTNARLSPTGLLRLKTFNGDVRLSLAARPADARIMALALNGQIKSDIPLNRRDTWGPRWAETTLGKGEPVISIDVVTGTVEIKSP